MRYRAGSESTGERETGFLEEMAKHPGIRILSSDQYGEATARDAMRTATQLLLRYEDEVDGVFAVCEPNCHGLLQALEQAGLAHESEIRGLRSQRHAHQSPRGR